jgi:N-acetylneuraminic acid mutarotase
MIYVIGGYGQDQPPSNAVQVYDTLAKKWKQVAPIPQGLHHLSVAALAGKIYVVGGFTGGFAKCAPVDSVWRYDPETDRWAERALLPTPRGALAVAVLEGRLYVMEMRPGSRWWIRCRGEGHMGPQHRLRFAEYCATGGNERLFFL